MPPGESGLNGEIALAPLRIESLLGFFGGGRDGDFLEVVTTADVAARMVVGLEARSIDALSRW